MFVFKEGRVAWFVVLTVLMLIATLAISLLTVHVSLVWLSMLLAFSMMVVLLFVKYDFFSPLPVFSIMFFGYVLGGLYYSFSLSSFGKFIDFTALSAEQTVGLMEWGLIYATACFVFFSLGYILSQHFVKYEYVFTPPSVQKGFMHFYAQYYLVLVVPLLFMGCSYWLYVAKATAGSVWTLVVFFQAFPHMVEDAGVSTLPYQFYYAGIYLWLLGIQVSQKKVGFVFVLFSLLGCLICLTTGRIMLSLTYLMAQVFFIALANNHLKKKMFVLFSSIMGLGFVIYFLRILSNYLFIGMDAELFENGIVKDFLFRVVGSGNVADLQQLAIIFYGFDVNNVMLGSTYLDTIRNSLGVYFGLQPSSVGLILKDMYFPETSGPPTPGAIGEAYANFNAVAVLFMFFVGFALFQVHSYVLRTGNYILLFIYSMFLVRFVFMYAKVDSTMMANFLWGVTPMLFCLMCFFSIYSLAKIGKKSNQGCTAHV